MTYELEFDPRALKEWSKLGETIKKAVQEETCRGVGKPPDRIGPSA